MSCCTPARQGAPLANIGERGTCSGIALVERVAFAGGRSFIGTDTPGIAEDGEGPRRPTKLAPFSIDATLVTNGRFAAFVSATGFVTEAERFGWSPVFRGLLEKEGSLSSAKSNSWWVRIDGASWRAPEGPGSDLSTRGDHPVVHVSWSDAKAFAA